MGNRDIKQFLISATIVLASLCIIDLTVEVLCHHGLKHMPDYSGAFARDNFTMNRLKDFDVLIVGSSRASHHYDAQMLIDSINHYTQSTYTIYNAGIDGHFLNYNTCRIEAILDRYRPKLLIFEVGESELVVSNRDIQSAVSQMAPYYQFTQQATQYLNRINHKTWIQMQSSMYRFNNKTMQIISSIMTPSLANNGYDPLYGEILTYTPDISKYSDIELSPYSVQSLMQVIEKCKHLAVNFVIVSSPRYQTTTNNNRLADICLTTNIPYIEIYNEDIFNTHPNYFKDAAHLNDTGAKVFTSMLFERLKPHIEQMK